MAPAKILLINDELNILRTLRRNLVSRGYEVAIALDNKETQSMIARTKFDLYILNLDFSTVDVDGLEICQQVREVSLAPIIVLSTVGSEKMKIEALDLGADDYLVTPFGMGEFLARVRSALRRWATYHADASEKANLIVSDDLLIDTDSRQVAVSGTEVHLTPTEYDLLYYLAKNENKVIAHRELLQSVWGPQYGNEREYLRVFVSQLRSKIEQDSAHPKHILTEPGVGYRFT
jgi:two-component system KDP operon response regulator KdpE